MSADIIKFLEKRPTVGKKRKDRRKRQLFFELVNECKEISPEPDMKTIRKIIIDRNKGNLTPIDIFAMYLYRKKLEQ